MREAPDARVVLEVALVRLARADLDDSAAALGDRVARLERARARATGAAPSAPPAPARPGRARRARRRPVLAAAPLGALRRQRRPAGRSGPVARRRRPGGGAAGPRAGRTPDPGRTRRPGRGGAVPDRDTLVEAWGDHVLRVLPAKAKALYSAGRFVAVTDGVASFALPNEAHRDRCDDVQAVVESALADHFGVPVPLRSGGGRGPTCPRPAARAGEPRDRPARPRRRRGLRPRRAPTSGDAVDSVGRGPAARGVPRRRGGGRVGVHRPAAGADRRAGSAPRHRPQVGPAHRLLPLEGPRRGRPAGWPRPSWP